MIASKKENLRNFFFELWPFKMCSIKIQEGKCRHVGLGYPCVSWVVTKKVPITPHCMPFSLFILGLRLLLKEKRADIEDWRSYFHKWAHL